MPDFFHTPPQGFSARKAVTFSLWAIYTAATVSEAEARLSEFEAHMGDFPAIAQSWQRNWAQIIPFFDYPPDIRAILYTPPHQCHRVGQ